LTDHAVRDLRVVLEIFQNQCRLVKPVAVG
jgi:hypothetical protein